MTAGVVFMWYGLRYSVYGGGFKGWERLVFVAWFGQNVAETTTSGTRPSWCGIHQKFLYFFHFLFTI